MVAAWQKTAATSFQGLRTTCKYGLPWVWSFRNLPCAEAACLVKLHETAVGICCKEGRADLARVPHRVLWTIHRVLCGILARVAVCILQKLFLQLWTHPNLCQQQPQVTLSWGSS